MRECLIKKLSHSGIRKKKIVLLLAPHFNHFTRVTLYPYWILHCHALVEKLQYEFQESWAAVFVWTLSFVGTTWAPQQPPSPPWGLTATSTTHPALPSGPQALEPHKGGRTREKKEPVALGRDYIPVRFFSPLGRPPLNPPLPWLESEQAKAGWPRKKGPYMCDEVLRCCIR